MLHPLKYVAFFFIAGLFTGNVLPLSYDLARLILAFFALAALATFLLNRKIFPFLLAGLFLPLGLLLFNGYPEDGLDIQSMDKGGKVVLEGVIIKREDLRQKKRLTIKVNKLANDEGARHIKANLLLTLGSGGDNAIPGQKIIYGGRLKSPRNFGNPGGFDYETYLKRKNIEVTSFAADDRYLVLIGRGSGLWRLIYEMRNKTEKAINGVAEGDAAGIIKTLTLGNKGEVEKKTLDAFRKAGTAHLLAISGLHMGIIAFFFFAIFRWLTTRSKYLLLSNMSIKGAAFLTIIPLTVYLLVSGMSSSAIRAYIMVMVYLLSLIIEREGEIYNTISAAALIILIIWPEALFDIAFQLSFTAVIAIVFMTPKLDFLLLKGEDNILKKWLNRVITFVCVSLSASFGTAPLVAHYFMEVSLISVISNLLLIPLIAFIAVPVSALALFISPISLTVAKAFFFVAALVIEVSLDITKTLSDLSFSSVLVSPPEPLEIVLYFALLISIFNIKKRWSKALVVIIPLFFILSGYWDYFETKREKKLELTFLSVGQGESTFIKFPRGKTMLIDGGGFYDNSFDVGRMVIRPYLLSQGIKRVDYAVLTHPHPDHMNGLLHILESFDVGEFWLPSTESDDAIFRKLLKIIDNREIKIIKINDDMEDKIIDGVNIQILHPSGDISWDAGNDSDINNTSVVMKITYGDKSFLLPADLEKEGERRLVEAGVDLKATVLKAPHHGSLTSSTPEFIGQVLPQYTVFTVGHQNRFGFPKEVVVKRYEDAGSSILRTDESGAITFRTDGSTLEISTHRKLQTTLKDEICC